MNKFSSNIYLLVCQFLKKPTDFVRDTVKVETSNPPLNTKSVSFQMIMRKGL